MEFLLSIIFFIQPFTAFVPGCEAMRPFEDEVSVMGLVLFGMKFINCLHAAVLAKRILECTSSEEREKRQRCLRCSGTLSLLCAMSDNKVSCWVRR